MAKPSTKVNDNPKGNPFTLIPMEKMPTKSIEVPFQPLPQLPAKPGKKG